MRVLSPPHQTIIVSSIEWMFACDQTALHHSTSPESHAGNAMTMIPLMPCPDATAQLHRTWPAPTHPHIPVATRTPARVLPVHRCSFYGLRQPTHPCQWPRATRHNSCDQLLRIQLNIISDAVAQKSTSTCRLPTTKPRGGSLADANQMSWQLDDCMVTNCSLGEHVHTGPLHCQRTCLATAAGQLGTSSTRSLPGHAGTPCTAWPDMHYPAAAAGC